MIDLNDFRSINLIQFFNSVKFRSRYHLVIDFSLYYFIISFIYSVLLSLCQESRGGGGRPDYSVTPRRDYSKSR